MFLLGQAQDRSVSLAASKPIIWGNASAEGDNQVHGVQVSHPLNIFKNNFAAVHNYLFTALLSVLSGYP